MIRDLTKRSIPRHPGADYHASAIYNETGGFPWYRECEEIRATKEEAFADAQQWARNTSSSTGSVTWPSDHEAVQNGHLAGQFCSCWISKRRGSQWPGAISGQARFHLIDERPLKFVVLRSASGAAVPAAVQAPQIQATSAWPAPRMTTNVASLPPDPSYLSEESLPIAGRRLDGHFAQLRGHWAKLTVPQSDCFGRLKSITRQAG
jgi:hypothetical protein